MSERKRELKKWLIDHPLDARKVEAAAVQLGLAPVTLRSYLCKEPMPQRVHDVFIRMGLPAKLLPRSSETKAEMLERNRKLSAENRELIRRLAKYEPEYVAREARA